MKQRLDTPSAPRTTFVRGALFCLFAAGIYFSAGRREEALHRIFSALLILMLVHLAFHPGRNEKVDFAPLPAEGKLPEGQETLARTHPLRLSHRAAFYRFLTVSSLPFGEDFLRRWGRLYGGLGGSGRNGMGRRRIEWGSRKLEEGIFWRAMERW